MNFFKLCALTIAFAVSFLAVGIPYWQIPYGKVGLPDTLMTPGLLVIVVAAFLLRAVGAASLWTVTGIVGASVPATVWARMEWETASDPTSHNLWPLEIVFVLPLGLGAAFAGAFVGALAGSLIARWRAARSVDEET